MFINSVEKYKTSLQANLSKMTPLDYSVGWKSYRKNMAFKGLMRDLQIFHKSLNLAELQAIKGKMYIKLKTSACLPYMWCLSRALFYRVYIAFVSLHSLSDWSRKLAGRGGGRKTRGPKKYPPPSKAKTRTNHRRNAHVNLGSGIGTRPKRWGVEWGVGSRGQFFHQYTIRTALHALFKMITQSFVMTWFVLQFPHLKVVVNSCIYFQALLVIKLV